MRLFRYWFIGLFPLVAAIALASPLSLDDRTLPGKEPGTILGFTHPEADTVVIRHSGDNWEVTHALQPDGDDASLWTISTEALGWRPGHYEFKFLVNNNWEEGANRYVYINAEGRIARPPALYLTWQRNPDTSITIHWHSDHEQDVSVVYYRPPDQTDWQQAEGEAIPFADTDRFIHTVEITHLTPETTYEFRIRPEEIYRFRTLPSTLSRPVRFIEGGDVFELGDVMDRMNALAGSRDPDFVIIGGDLAYEDGRPELAWRWHRYFESFHRHLRAPDGRMIPVVVALGNHETPDYYIQSAENYEPGPAWQLAAAPFFYRLFAMPGLPGYQVLDFGDYASFILLDTDHTSPIAGPQTEWLKARLEERSSVPHLFPVYHVPAYPSVRNMDDDRNRLIRETWVPLFEQAGITLAFEHHDHAFKVTHPIRGGRIDPDGIVFAGDGAWGVNLRTPHDVEATWYLRKAASVHHVFEVTLESNRRRVLALDVQGRELDAFEQKVPILGKTIP